MPIERGTDGNASNREQGVTGSISIPFGEIPPGESRSVECFYYAGPKDYMILSSLGMEQDKVMQFNPFEWVSGPMNWLLNKLHDILGNFGLAIIFLTILLKLVLWPLTAKATRSQKRMQALQEPMAKLREKHKADSQKMNQEMMKFYKEQGVNPFAGCWPILVQMPIFLGMFYMLRSAAELYGQSFLWVSDLSEQDNVADIAGFSINALPFVMLATQWFQMKLTPMQLGPDASDSQRINAKMMRMMPFMFLVFLYFFSSALVLYWTVQNTMSIFQTLITKKGKSPKEIETERSILAKDEAKISQKKPDADFIEEEERQHRQVLGLKLRGKLNKKQIDEIYRGRMEKYHPDKLRNLGAKRQDEAMQKKERLEAAYEFLLKKLANKS
jgi:YidC/Oxa1 family membrane protein insertase